jgi:hypothetical protein
VYRPIRCTDHTHPLSVTTAASLIDLAPDDEQLLTKATPRLLMSLPVRLHLGRPQMPELQGDSLHLSRLSEGHLGVAVVLAFIGQEFLVGHRRQFLTSHFGHQ